jgi:hypothetical protein
MSRVRVLIAKNRKATILSKPLPIGMLIRNSIVVKKVSIIGLSQFVNGYENMVLRLII